MVPLENISLHLHFTLFYIIFLALFIMYYSPSVTPLFIHHYLLFSRPSSMFSSLPLLFSPSILLPVHSIFPHFSAPISSHPTRSLYHTLYSLFLFLIPLSLPLFIFLFISTSLPTSLPNFHFLHFTLLYISFSFYKFLSLTLPSFHSPLHWCHLPRSHPSSHFLQIWSTSPVKCCTILVKANSLMMTLTILGVLDWLIEYFVVFYNT